MRREQCKRPTIGVLVGWESSPGVMYSFLEGVLAGIRATVRALGCNLLLACSSMRLGATQIYPAWPHLSPDVDFVPVGPWNTDGLIVVNPLFSETCAHYIQEVIAAGHPVVFVGHGERGTVVAPDNEDGIRQAVAHLTAHGHRRIAFLSEPRWGDGVYRLAAYRAAVREYNLEDDPALIVCGDHSRAGGRRAARQLLTAGVPFTAVLGSNDESAIGAMEVLHEAGLNIPGDVAVIGFDDCLAAQTHNPPLTTLRYPSFETGRFATELLLEHIAGKKEIEVIHLPVQLVIRESCGCRPGVAVQLFQRDVSSDRAWLEENAEQGLAQIMTAAVINGVRQSDSGEVLRCCQRLAKAFLSGVAQGNVSDFVTAFGDILHRVPTDDLHAWLSITSAIVRAKSLLQASLPKRQEYQDNIEKIFHQVLSAVHENLHMEQTRRIVAQANISEQLTHMTSRMLTTPNEQRIFQILQEHLPGMGIQRADVAFFEAEGNDPVAWTLLHPIPGPSDTIVRFPTRQFPPTGLYARTKPFSLALLPLQIQEGKRGFVAFETDILGPHLVAIVRQLAAALWGAQLYHQAVEGRRAAEEASRLKSSLLSIVSHELRTPLSLILGLSELMLHRTQDGEVSLEHYRQDAELVYTTAQHLEGLLRDVLDLARSEAGQLTLSCEPLDLAGLLRQVAVVAAQMVRGKGLAWYEEIPETLPTVLGDQIRLRQVVLNLVSNAVKFTDRGEVRLSAEAGAGVVTVTVSDTGLGIPPHEQEAIFDEFRQSERTIERGYGGMGLGLAICKRLITLHGGKIWARSSGEEGSGSAFSFTLPTLEALPSESELALPSQQATSPLGGGAAREAPPLFYSLPRECDGSALLKQDCLTKPIDTSDLIQAIKRQRILSNRGATEQTILVVDDDLPTLEMYARVLRTHFPSCRVLTARNGREALESIERELPALVILDLMMPYIDGFGVLEAIQKRESIRSIPVIVLTGRLLTEEDMTRFNQGVVAVLGKGLFSLEETLAHIELALARGHNRRSESQRIVRKAMAYIHEHYAEPLSREDIARYVGLGDRHLARCFQHELGISPLTYLNRYRINRAKALLEMGDKSITEVALDVGFSSSSYFCQVFHREIGVSPGAYRLLCRRFEHLPLHACPTHSDLVGTASHW